MFWQILAVVAELCGWLGGAANRTETFAWFRIQAHLGLGGFVVALCGGLAFAAWKRSLPPAWIGALLLHLPFWDVAQAQPDAATWFTLAQHVARAPVATLLHWPSVAWAGEEGRFHQPFPGVPAIYGLAFRLFGESDVVIHAVLTAWAVALPVAVTWAARAAGPRGPATDRAARLAGWIAVAFPLLQAQSGWLLADIPLCTALALAWGVLLRARSPKGWALAAFASLPALSFKVSALLYVGLPALALLLPLRLFFGVWVVGMAAIAGQRLPRLHGPGLYIASALGLFLHLRPAAWVSLASMRIERRTRLLVGVLSAIPFLVLWSPAEHVPRYALPVGIALAIHAAFASARVGRFLVGSGLVLLLGGYLPVVRLNQAVNLQEATRLLTAQGVESIEVWADAPATTFPPAALAALVDLYTPLPVRTGEAVRLAPPGTKRRWWEMVEPPPWRARVAAEPAGQGGAPSDGLLLCVYGGDAAKFEASNPGWTRVGVVSRYRASSQLLPREVVAYKRTR